MRIGFQKGYLIFRFRQKKFVVGITEILCVIGGIFLFFAAELQNRQSPLQEGYISRASYGQGEKQVELMVGGLEEEEVEVGFLVGERQYTKEQAKAAMEDLGKRLEGMILGENASLKQVQTRLNLPTRDEITGFRIRWSSDDMERIGLDGTVDSSGVDEVKGAKVRLEAEVKDGQGGSQVFPFLAVVFPDKLSEKELQVQNIRDAIAEEEQRSRTEEGFYLPREYEGRPLVYGVKGGKEHVWLLVLGPLMAVLLRARGKSEDKKRKKERERKLLLDYSEVVSKLQIFLGAGMTVRTAWERIALDYQMLREKGEAVRPAYEEMLQTYYQLKSGAPEGKAYEEFGRRCVLQPYLKLAGLLEQNRKTGTKNLRQLLLLEMTDAFEQRKNLARRQGEEAATKLLIPLFLMLGVVMVIVVVPAFLTFY